MVTRISLHSEAIESVFADIRAIYDANRLYYSRLRLRSVAVRAGTEWQNACTALDMFPTDAVVKEEASRQYRDVELLERWYAPDRLFSLLDEISTKRLDLSGRIVHFGPNVQFLERSFLPSMNSHSPLSGSLYEVTGNGRVDLSNEPLLAYELPFYPDVRSAIGSWVLNLPADRVDSQTGRLQVFLPECRARFGKFTHAHGALSIEVVSVGVDPGTLVVKGALGAQEHLAHVDARVVGQQIRVDLPDDADRLELYLLGPAEQLYDWHEETPHWYLGQTRALARQAAPTPGEAAVRQAIRSGEGERIEFKPYVEPGDSKAEEVVTTSLAFANTKGGTIFIGIRDDCTITGIEDSLRRTKEFRAQQVTIQQAMEGYMGALRQLIASRLNRDPGISIERVQVSGATVLAVQVPEGEAKPHFNPRAPNVYVRRGASNVLADPDTDLRELLQGAGRIGALFQSARRRRR